MSLFGLFDIGKSAIFASQAALNVAAHNISNVNNPEYCRQEAVLATRRPETGRGYYLGRGVDVVEVRRHFDSHLNSQFLAQRQIYGRSTALGSGLARAEQVLNEVASGRISDSLDSFFNAWEEVANNPHDVTARTILLQKGQNLVQGVKSIDRGFEDLLAAANAEITDAVEQVNRLAAGISNLNKEVLATGGKANDLLDQRDKLLGELADLVGYSHFYSDDGSVNVIVGQKTLVAGSLSYAMEVVQAPGGDKSVAIHSVDVGERLVNGKLGGLFTLKDNIRNDLIAPFREMAGSIIDEVNSVHRQGYGLDGSTGLDFFLPADTSDLDRLVLDFDVALSSPLEVAAAQGAGLTGDNRNALDIAALRGKAVISGATFEGHYQSLVTKAGSMSRAAQDGEGFEGVILSDLRGRKDSVSGVSLDEEAVDLIRFQHAFEAGARLIRVTDELLDTVLNLGRM